MRNLYCLIAVMFVFSGAGAQIINFPDANFKAKLLMPGTGSNSNGAYIPIDTNNNGEIEQSEAAVVYKLDIFNANISDLTGIENFTGLRDLYCPLNQITQIPTASLPNLLRLYCGQNPLQSLDLTGMDNLKSITCAWTPLTQLTMCDCPGIEEIWLGNNAITTFSVAHRPNLTKLIMPTNELTNLDISDCNNLSMLWIRDNHLTNVDFNSFPNLEVLNVMYNPFPSLDVSGLTHLTTFYASGNYLATTINMKNGSHENALEFADMPNLQFVCTDDSELDNVLTLASQYQYDNCVVNSYCSFNSGGITYDISGETRFDIDNNGCSTTDVIYPYLKINLTDGSNTGGLIADASGNFRISVPAGNYAMAPALENPTYFTVSPAVLNVAFPAQASPFQQNFCMTPNGIHHDLEITLLPLDGARPGFDSEYKIIYKNKGTQIESGLVNLNFNGSILDFTVSNPAVSSQITNVLQWNFNNLLPFETREIVFTLNVNAPNETPPVVSGNVLNFTAWVGNDLVDETPSDNTFNAHQNVVNAVDPNDKNCLEGATITPEMVGKYVHYIIRFENTGTANAENIVVKDMIDTAKFDVSSLVPLDGSHPFVTKINGNKVEFIFENINLPFDDANNDGYVAFKIKTNPTLALGDTFSNTASIYFDYNFPIVTEPAVTAITALAKQDFAFDNYFRIYPNPASDVLKIESKQNIEVHSISIYNTLGQLVLVVPNAKTTKTVDVSGLPTGNYVIKLATGKGSTHTNFIKL